GGLPPAARRAACRHPAAAAARRRRSGRGAAADLGGCGAARDPAGRRHSGRRRRPARRPPADPLPPSPAAFRGVPLRSARAARPGAAAGAPEPPARRPGPRARAASGPDEAVAEALERSAAGAQARGGIAASAAFLETAAALTPDPAERVRRLLAAARAKRDAGALQAAVQLLTAAEGGSLSALQAAEVEHLRGQIAFDQRRLADAARLLLSAAKRLDGELARTTYLEAIGAAMWAADADAMRAAAEGARAAAPGSEPVDVVLDALAVRLTDGFA